MFYDFFIFFFFFKQKTAYEMRISDWSSDVCSSDLHLFHRDQGRQIFVLDCLGAEPIDHPGGHIMDGNERTGGGTAIGHRLHDDRGFESAKPYAAGFFRHIDAAETKLRRRANGVAREDVFFIPFRRMGRNGVCGELARHILYGALIVRKVKLTGHETTLSAHCGNDECVFPSNRTIRPALGDCLDLRPELHAFHAVLVGVAKCRTLPATKGMVSDWNRDRPVDADHADIYTCREFTAGEIGRASGRERVCQYVKITE